MARAKNTSRAEARRRTREETRAELAAEQEPEDGGEAAAATDKGYQPRRSGVLFKWPDLRGDVRAVPEMFRAKKLMWLPYLLIAVGFVLAVVYGGLSADLQPYAALYFQWFFNPVALFTFFIAGFVAPRASYLVGGIAGLVLSIALLAVVLLGATSAFGSTAPLPTDFAVTALYVLFTTTMFGIVAGGFAGWYRDFLRRMQDNSKARQAQREQEAKAKRASDRQEARRAAKATR